MIYLFTIGALVVAMVLESISPRRQIHTGLAWRWVNNFSLKLEYLRAPAGSRFDRMLALPFNWRGKMARYHEANTNAGSTT